jgi:hypothetical protein
MDMYNQPRKIFKQPQYNVTDLLRAITVESQQPAIARERPVNNNNEAVFSMWSVLAIMSCNNWGIIGDGVFCEVRAKAPQGNPATQCLEV